MRRQKQTKMISEINVVPYIDVMLVLLIIFMMSAPLISYGVKIELPVVSNAKVIDNKKTKAPLIITIKRNGELFMVEDNNEVKLSIKELIIKLKSHKIVNPERKAFIRGDHLVKYGVVVNVMSVLQRNGINNIGLITENK